MRRIARWIARVFSLLLVGLVALIFVGEGLAEGFPNPAVLTLEENLGLFAFFLMTGGLALAWKTELGTLLTILGYIAFCFIERELMGGLFALFPVTALLLFVTWHLPGDSPDRPAAGRSR